MCQRVRIKRGTDYDWACTRRIIMESRQGSNEFRKADLVLANIVREVYVLEERISDTAGGR